MKTKEMVQKYKQIIGSLLKLDPEGFVFEVTNDSSYRIQRWEHIGEDIKDPEKDEVYQNQWCLGQYRLRHGTTEIASWKLYQMPHCCGIVVSCNALVEKEFRGKRVGTALNNLRQEIGRGLGYSVMLCTDIESNEHQRKLLKTNGWTDLLSFVNKRTKNRVIISTINL